MYVDPLIAMLLPLPLPDVPAVEPPAPAEPEALGLPLVDPAAPLVEPEAPLVEPDAPVVEPAAPLAPEPIRALVSMYCAPLVRAELEAEPAVPLVPVAPEVPLLPPPCRHPVTVIARLLLEL